MADKTDRRVQYTKAALKQSLLELMRSRPIDKITVKQLCETADINRGTFYAHYNDPYDLLRQIEDELFDEILGAVETSLTSEAITQLLTEIFETIVENSELCGVLFSQFGDKAFLRRIMFIAHDKSIDEWRRFLPSAEPKQLEMLYVFFANGCVAIIEDWVQRGMEESPTQLVTFIEKITVNSLRAFMQA